VQQQVHPHPTITSLWQRARHRSLHHQLRRTQLRPAAPLAGLNVGDLKVGDRGACEARAGRQT
jgi:hypothetical protein